jgi:hypothetical protein
VSPAAFALEDETSILNEAFQRCRCLYRSRLAELGCLAPGDRSVGAEVVVLT